MTDQEFIQYRDTRYKKILEYYDDRAQKSQLWYHGLSVYILLVSIAISPILTIDTLNLKIFGLDGRLLAAVLSPTIALAAGILTHYKLHENWLSYRSIWDALKHEVHFRDSKILDYKAADDRNALFVERVEMLISYEGQEWFCRQSQKDRSGKVNN